MRVRHPVRQQPALLAMSNHHTRHVPQSLGRTSNAPVFFEAHGDVITDRFVPTHALLSTRARASCVPTRK